MSLSNFNHNQMLIANLLSRQKVQSRYRLGPKFVFDLGRLIVWLPWSGQPSSDQGKFFSKKATFQLLSCRLKKISLCRVKKFQSQTRSGPLFTAVKKYPRDGWSGHGPSLVQRFVCRLEEKVRNLSFQTARICISSFG